jgi:hypothetical protein
MNCYSYDTQVGRMNQYFAGAFDKKLPRLDYFGHELNMKCVDTN